MARYSTPPAPLADFTAEDTGMATSVAENAAWLRAEYGVRVSPVTANSTVVFHVAGDRAAVDQVRKICGE
jgi:hypothetical protein